MVEQCGTDFSAQWVQSITNSSYSDVPNLQGPTASNQQGSSSMSLHNRWANLLGVPEESVPWKYSLPAVHNSKWFILQCLAMPTGPLTHVWKKFSRTSRLSLFFLQGDMTRWTRNRFDVTRSKLSVSRVHTSSAVMLHVSWSRQLCVTCTTNYK